MHAFASSMMGNENRSGLGKIRIDESLDSVSNRVEWMEDVEETWTGGQMEIQT